VVVGDLPAKNLVEPVAELPDRAALQRGGQRALHRALDRAPDHVLDIAWRDLDECPPAQPIPIAVGEHLERGDSRRVADLPCLEEVLEQLLVGEGVQLGVVEGSEAVGRQS